MKVLLALTGIGRQNRIAEPNRDPLALLERPAISASAARIGRHCEQQRKQ
jgi:hypothetical protein